MSENIIINEEPNIPNFLLRNKKHDLYVAECLKLNHYDLKYRSKTTVKSKHIDESKVKGTIRTLSIFAIILAISFISGQKEHPETASLDRMSTALLQTGMFYSVGLMLKGSLSGIKKDMKYMIDVLTGKIKD